MLTSYSLAAETEATQQSAAPAISGYEFRSAELQNLQDDEFANPGYLWVEKGKVLWGRQQGAANKSCADCHGDQGAEIKDVATRYPRYDQRKAGLLNLEQQINVCRQRRQYAPKFAYESDELLSLTAFVANLSRGMAVNVSIDGPARKHFESGRTYFETRLGQLNLACKHCHEFNVGRQLRGDKISQGQSNGFPAYRLEWQTLGSLHRRLRACNQGVRAELLSYGSAKYLDLELYLAWRAKGLKVETPAVRP